MEIKRSLFLAAAAAAPAVLADDSLTEKPTMPFDPQTAKPCTYWYNNDGSKTCGDMLADTFTDASFFLQWNPSLTGSCGNFNKGQSYCIEASRASTTTTTTTTKATSTTTQPVGTTTTSPSNGITTPLPTQHQIADNCNKFYYVITGETCDRVAEKNSISLDNLLLWNPSIGGPKCTGLWGDAYACVGTLDAKPDDRPSPTQEGIAADCTQFYKVKTGDQCDQIASSAHISVSDLYQWNPAIQTDCTKLLAGYYVCTATKSGPSKPTTTTTTTTTTTSTSTTPTNGISTPAPTQAGMASYCTKFYKVQSGDGCWQIAKDKGIELDDLYRWNPAVGNDCRGLQANTYICIGVAAFRAKTGYHNDCTGGTHNDNIVSMNEDGPCINTDCQVASLDILADGSCPDGQVQISYWEKPNCQGKWFGYGYASRGTCRSLWSYGWKFKSLHLRCSKQSDDCVSKGTCKEDPEPSNNIC